MTLSDIQRATTRAESLKQTTQFADLPAHLRAPVEHDIAAVPAILRRANERIAHIQQNVLLSDEGKRDQIAAVWSEEEHHLDRHSSALETDMGTYTRMREKVEAGHFVKHGSSYIEQPPKPETGDERVTGREIRDRMLALPQAERNRMYFAAVQSGDVQLQRAVENAPAAFPVVTNSDAVRRLRLETSPAAAGLAHLRQALELRDDVIGSARRAWEDDKRRVLTSRR